MIGSKGGRQGGSRKGGRGAGPVWSWQAQSPSEELEGVRKGWW
jgi:hypothetical protein